MNPYGPRRGPIFWLLPLIIGVVLGGMFFGGSHGGAHFEGAMWNRAEFAPAAAQPPSPEQAALPPSAPQPPDARFEARGEHWRNKSMRHDHDWGFFPFGGLRLLLPLLLIGTGAWLAFGRRGPQPMQGSPGGWAGPGPQPAQQYGPGSYPAQPGAASQAQQQAAPPPPAGPYTAPPTPNQPPATGETRIL